MAESFAAWVHETVAPSFAKTGENAGRAVENNDPYECRTRNRIPAAKLFTHAHNEVIDLRPSSSATVAASNSPILRYTGRCV